MDDRFDPFFFVQAPIRFPDLWPTHRRFLEEAAQDSLRRIADIDTVLEELCAERLTERRRLAGRRARPWPALPERSFRTRPAVDQAPFPPAPADAEELFGAELRAAGLEVLRRHGPLALRDLHAPLHRYGFTVGGERPVQRLADAMAYEVTRGRLERVARGVDEAVRATSETGRRRPVGPDLRADPLHWAAGRWPDSAQLDGDPFVGDLDDADEVELAEDLQATMSAIRARLAGLVDPDRKRAKRARRQLWESKGRRWLPPWEDP